MLLILDDVEKHTKHCALQKMYLKYLTSNRDARKNCEILQI